MKTISSILLILSIFSCINAQAQNASPDVLKEAQHIFEEGRYQEIPSLLRSYPTDKSLLKSQRLQAAELLALAYLQLKDRENAGKNFVHLLQLNPHYADETNIPELQYFTRGYKSWRLLFGSSMGLQFAPVSFGEHVEMPFVKTLSQRTGIDGRAYLTAWIGLDIFRSDNLEVIFEFRNAPTRYEYYETMELTPSDATADLEWEESTDWFEFNLIIQQHFPIRKLSFGGRVRYYAQLGGGYARMGESRLENIKLEIEDKPDTYRLDGLIINREGESLRRKGNYNVLAGLGMTYRISPTFSLYGEARYNLRVKNFAKPDNGYWNETLVRDFYYVDDEMWMHGVSFSAGIRVTHFFRWREVNKN